MYNIILILFFCVFTANTYGEPQQQKGEKKMATLILDELFTGTTRAHYESRGWWDGTSRITTSPGGDGYKFEIDPTLGRNVMYAHLTTDPRMPAPAWRFEIPNAVNGATMYALFKFHNVITTSGGEHWTRFGRGFGRSTPANANGQMDMDIAGVSQGNWNTDSETGVVGIPASRTFHYYAGGAIGYAKTGASNILSDGIWYEMAYYLTPGECGNMRVVWRRYGDQTWIDHMRGTCILTASGSGNINQFLIGIYLNGADRNSNDIRNYFGRIQLFTGNAIADGNLPGGSSGGGGGGNTDTTGPVITDKVAVTTSTTATIGWTTDEDSNTVVDYGTTETRGTIARGAESTRNHVVEITGLTPSTTYYYRFSSRDAAGNTTMDQANSTFITKAVEDTTRPVISGINVTTETTTANVTWSTDENSNSNVDYGTTDAYGASAAGNASTQEHVVVIAGLTEGTTYNYRVRSADASGNEAVSDNATFVTEKTPVTPVEVSLNDLIDVTLVAPVDGQVMMYRGGQWVNVDPRPLVAELVEEILGATSLVVNKPSA